MRLTNVDYPSNYWHQRSEGALNWLALGMLLAAWNACDNLPPNHGRPAEEQMSRRRPEALGAYAYVSVRAYKGHETVNEL